MLSAQIIPEGDSVFFSNWVGPTELPSPDEVREHYDVPDRRAAVVVRFVHLDLVVKYCPHVRAAEGQALWVIEHFTDVRAPTVYGWFQDGDEMFLYMSLVDGVPLERRWPEMSKNEKLDVSCQLECMLASMRALPWTETYIGPSRYPRNFVGSLGHTPCHDGLFWSYPGHPGPFASSKDFHDFFTTINLMPAAGEFATLTRRGLPDNLPIVFTHNDLHFGNILISPTGNGVIAIINWEASGFYPAYWEWAKLTWAEGRRGSFFIDKILRPHMDVWKYCIEWLRFKLFCGS